MSRIEDMKRIAEEFERSDDGRWDTEWKAAVCRAIIQEIEELQAEAKGIKWRPIETAPKDGESFVSLNADQGNLKAVTWWSPLRQYYCATGGQQLYKFTHWMPLPSAPTVTKAMSAEK